jgi:amidohydrolase
MKYSRMNDDPAGGVGAFRGPPVGGDIVLPPAAHGRSTLAVSGDTMTTVKDQIGHAVDRLADELESLSHRIHDTPELAYGEVNASAWLADFLSGHGFAVEHGVAEVPTAFRATLETGVGPTVAILCEYDALPGIGHACGHNVIAASGAGAGAALAAVRGTLPAGRVQVIGTPAEEGGGGKIKLIEGGVFGGVDAAMMIHGFDRWILHQDLLGIVRVGFEFTGKAAHAAMDPWEGVNALDAVIQTFNNVSMLRQQVRLDARIHGIVTQGGVAPNIIPEVAACTFYVRAAGLDYMWALRARVVACAEGAAVATGCAVKVVDVEAPYEPLRRNDTLLGLFRANMTALGAVESPALHDRLGSSDVGNVSQVVPAIQPMVQIAPLGTPIHSRAFEAAAVSPLARQGLCQAAKTMAMTTYDLLADPRLLKQARSEFEAAA